MKNILFDLDGTVTDPYSGISQSVIYAYAKFGLPQPDEKVLKSFIGPPLYDSFKKYCGFSDGDARLAVNYYREYYVPNGIFDCEVYDGIPQTFAALRANGKNVYLATSKPEPFAVRILEKFELLKYFCGVAGATFDGTRVEKVDVISYALKKFSITGSALMVGDRKYDIIGAKACGLKSMGVTYGFGEEEELVAASADYIAKTPAGIADIILKD